MKSFARYRSGLLAGLALFPAAAGFAHPIPDVPVRSHFDGEGNLELRVEVDTRAYLEDPESELYLLKVYFDLYTDEEKAAEIAPAQQFVDDRVEFRFASDEEMSSPDFIQPEFEWHFATLEDKALENLDDPVVLIGVWNTKIPNGAKYYQIVAKDKGTLTVIFENYVKGEKLERLARLWPNESSFALDLAEFDSTVGTDTSKHFALLGVVSIAMISGVLIATLMLIMRSKPTS